MFPDIVRAKSIACTWDERLGAAISLQSSGHLQVDVWLVCVHSGARPSERQRIEAFIRHSEHSWFKPLDLLSFADLCREAGDSLFSSITETFYITCYILIDDRHQTPIHVSA